MAIGIGDDFHKLEVEPIKRIWGIPRNFCFPLLQLLFPKNYLDCICKRRPSVLLITGISFDSVLRLQNPKWNIFLFPKVTKVNFAIFNHFKIKIHLISINMFRKTCATATTFAYSAVSSMFTVKLR